MKLISTFVALIITVIITLVAGIIVTSWYRSFISEQASKVSEKQTSVFDCELYGKLRVFFESIRHDENSLYFLIKNEGKINLQNLKAFIFYGNKVEKVDIYDARTNQIIKEDDVLKPEEIKRVFINTTKYKDFDFIEIITNCENVKVKIFKPESYINWLSDWQYRIPITIKENSGKNLNDYQVLITLDTQSLISAGKMKSDCGDIRFTDSDGTTLLNYWLESGCNSASTKLWVKVPFIPASSTKTIYVYYGNPNATSASNGVATFVWFDDFEDGILDGYTLGGTLGWKIATDRVYQGTYSAGSDPAIGNNQDSWMEKTFEGPIAISFYDSVSSESGWDFLQFLINGVEQYKISGEVGWTKRSFTTGAGTITLRWRYYKDGSVTAGADRGWIDNLVIRKYTSPEPTITLGKEEEL